MRQEKPFNHVGKTTLNIKRLYQTTRIVYGKTKQQKTTTRIAVGKQKKT